MVCRDCKDRDDVAYTDLVGAPGICEVCRRAVAALPSAPPGPLQFADIPLGSGPLRQGNPLYLHDLIVEGHFLIEEARKAGRERDALDFEKIVAEHQRELNAHNARKTAA